MLIEYLNGNETVKINNVDILVESIKIGKLNKDSRVYDAEDGAYRILGEIQEIKDIALDPKINQHLQLDINKIKSEMRIQKNQKNKELVYDIVSLAFLIFGFIINVNNTITKIKLISGIYDTDFTNGRIIGSLIGKVLMIILVWTIIWSKSKKSHKKSILIIFSVLSFIFLSTT